MYFFKDKGNRDICLIPEATAIIQKLYNDSLSKNMKRPIQLFYEQKCYRYEKPQEGRYREFTQFGIEILGNIEGDKDTAIRLLKECISIFGELDKDFFFKENIKRGLNYYIEDGFEIECPYLGAQKQVAGGGRYKEGIGWAIGIDRLIIAKNKIK